MKQVLCCYAVDSRCLAQEKAAEKSGNLVRGDHARISHRPILLRSCLNRVSDLRLSCVQQHAVVLVHRLEVACEL